MAAPPNLPPQQRDEFKAYLERTGVVDALTRVIVNLLAEQNKPQNALEFLKAQLGNSVELDNLRKENAELRKANEDLRRQLAEAQAQLPKPV